MMSVGVNAEALTYIHIIGLWAQYVFQLKSILYMLLMRLYALNL